MTTTLGSIGEAILATDSSRRITFVNRVAEDLTGWRAEEAMGKDIDTVFPLRDGRTREPIPGPVATILRDGKGIELAADTILVCRDEDKVEESPTRCRSRTKRGRHRDRSGVPRHQRAPSGGRGPAADAEDGCGRPARGRRGPRLQQPAHRHQRLRDAGPQQPDALRGVARSAFALSSGPASGPPR